MLTALPASLISIQIPMGSVSYGAWILLAFEVAGVWALAVFGINALFYRDKVLRLLKTLRKKLKTE
jgi:hypothetical protein